MDFFTAVSSILNIIQYVFYLPTVTVGVVIGFACFVNLSSFGIGAVTESFVFVLIREMVDTVASFLYLPAFIINLIVLLISFGTFLHMSSSFLENLILTRYTETVRRSHLPKHRTPLKFAPSICFMGGGQLWMFALGVGHYVYENFDINSIKFFASSCGTFVAVPLACGLDPYDWCRRDWSKCIAHFESRGILGCLCDSKYFYYNLWNDYLPEDAHIRCSGRLFISVTLFPSMKNRVISQFNSREELIWAVVGSICVPFVFIRDFPIKCGEDIGYVIDGGFSNDSPCLDSYTITVSALHREADIKPLDYSYITNTASVSGSKNRVLKDDVSPDVTADMPLDVENSAAYKYKIRITSLDIVRVPKYERVWEVAGIGLESAAKCVDFQRHEWESIRRDIQST